MAGQDFSVSPIYFFSKTDENTGILKILHKQRKFSSLPPKFRGAKTMLFLPYPLVPIHEVWLQ